ncbi:MAG: 50S ribosomal protein L25 [Deltaproteobacteria bacterium]|nr:50S ribosomal protein L25/general stress protein Ctc [Deltaproteobacteria bacterium]OQY15702.1 MAG: 50S ribosomal protein L25/general stress protein Ctc [Desulfobacterium sp. 4572_20]RLJ04872.1 MAG: 50S ribosomal protein L25 [Candidatus Aenigmarchaeota archaeon]MBW2105831.1 50S ribosomal protein L25/general stress protein Ctc [Deltaproteobacteria bacterium]MBW2332361.1 50S ribosomal protein L25/general stress protein Ctc [Deltaproteobacteria bacterium]
MAAIQLDSKKRTMTGKGSARKLRSGGRLPGILYGPNTSPIRLSLDYKQFQKTLRERSAENIIFALRIDSNGKNQPKRVMIKEIQKDPVTREYLHVDFYEISMEKELEVDIPVYLVNTPIGVKGGGILEHIRRELKISCMPKNLIDKIEVDVSGLDIGQSLHIEDINLAPGLKSIEDGDLTIATVVAPTIEKEKVEEEVEEEVEGAGSEEIKVEEKS